MPVHLFLLFVLGVLAGGGAVAVVLLPRLRSATQALDREAEHAQAKIALVAGTREQLAEQMKAISADALAQVSAQVAGLAAAQREADRAAVSGELGKRARRSGAASTRSRSTSGGWSATGWPRTARCASCSSP